MAIFADEFTDMMAATLTVETFLGRTDRGEPLYATAATYQCRINYDTHNVIGPNNQLVVARGVAWLDTVNPIAVDDRVTFSDGTQPIILVSIIETDEDGPAYTRLDFQ